MADLLIGAAEDAAASDPDYICDLAREISDVTRER